MTNQQNNINNSLDKALDLLKYFSEENPVRGLSEISRISSIPKATVYRLFNTFEKNGFLQKVDIQGKQNQYKLGMKFFELGMIVSESIKLKETALPFMEKLRDLLNEDVQLVIRDNNYAIYIEKLICTHPVRLFTKTGRKAPLSAGACSRAILSFLDDEEIQQILDNQSLEKYTETTIIDKDELWKKIEESRIKGYTISFGELEPQTVSVGVPIFDYSQKVIAAISVAGPEQRFNSENLPLIIEETKKTAKKISKVLGYNLK
ncbi:IclR family transcriptional regulator [Clostridium cochlearium]|uniref:IclR family transcriptional regulator n=1 Tax=Clostridium cochlearium TaxID=1494 RepID=A0A7Y3V8I5_CLOCO|nr:IclR family transcriptional regulator [Clostridium cochlearium]NOH15431.1 IclR family transcriptional regulator [Clostridium cochlearium]